MKQRTIFVGDVHGCFDELQLLMKKLAPSSRDRVIFLGDLVGKGFLVEEVVEFVCSRGYECLMGNHEWKYLERARAGLVATLAPRHHEWVSSLPLYIEAKNFIAVHGGIPPEPSDFRRAEPWVLLTIRNWENGQPKDEGGVPWHGFYRGEKRVVYGHWAKQGLHRTPNTIGLDTGCVYGGSLSAYILESDEIVQVRALRTYKAHGPNS